jgi:hypothetical protein
VTKVVSLNGRDGSGKSQQLRLLSWQNNGLVHVTKSLTQYDSRWPVKTGYESSRWWFEQVPMEELANIIIESLNVRNRDRAHGRVTVHDRGWRMFKCVCAATKMTRENVSLGEANRWAEEKFSLLASRSFDEKEVVFDADDEYFGRIQSVSRFIRPPEDTGFPEEARRRYARYQSHLATAMESEFRHSGVTRIPVHEPIFEVQNRLRAIVNRTSGISLPEVGKTFSLVVGFGGLSECGKSSFAEYLRTSHGFLRLKLRYFIEVIRKRGENPTPEAVALELLAFLSCHYYVPRVSIESLHDPYVPAMLKLMFGQRFKIVYIETDVDIRVRRAAQELGMPMSEARVLVEEKDETKKSRGAESVRTIADLIFNNSSDTHAGNLRAFADQLDF